MSSNIQILKNGLNQIKSLKPTDWFEKMDKKQKLYKVKEAINCLTGNLPEYITEALKTGRVTQEQVDAHIKRTVNEAVEICTEITLKSI